MRDASTYRGERRNRWHETVWMNRSWADFNTGWNELHARFGVGTRLSNYRQVSVRRSKYMPHIGAKQRAKASK